MRRIHDCGMFLGVLGVVPHEPEVLRMADGDVVTVRTWPCWGMDVKCGKNTDISYGPWSDRQRYVCTLQANNEYLSFTFQY